MAFNSADFILNSDDIHDRCLGEDMIVPYDPDLLNPVSLDVRIGHSYIREQCLRKELKPGEYIEVEPKEFLLVSTYETFNLPRDIAAEFRLKSTRAREGWNQLLAVWLEPGWHNAVLTLELVNENRFTPLYLTPLLPIGQVIFYRVKPGSVDYGQIGHYNNDKVVRRAKYD